MVKKTKNIKNTKTANKTAEFSNAARNAEIKTIYDRPNFIVRLKRSVINALRWTFVTAPRAMWNWICRLDISGLCNMTMLLLIIVLFSILIGQVLGPRCKNSDNAIVPVIKVPEITAKEQVYQNVAITEKSAPAQIVTEEIIEETTFVFPMKMRKVYLPLSVKPLPEPMFIKIDGDVIIDGTKGNARLPQHTKINGDLILQNMASFTLPCGIKINGNLMVRNVKTLNFCGCFAVRGNIYVSSNSSFGPIPRGAYINGQVIF